MSLSEKDMNAVVCLDMAGVNTIIKNPETKEPKTFAFDFSYWSHTNTNRRGRRRLTQQLRARHLHSQPSICTLLTHSNIVVLHALIWRTL